MSKIHLPSFNDPTRSETIADAVARIGRVEIATLDSQPSRAVVFVYRSDADAGVNAAPVARIPYVFSAVLARAVPGMPAQHRPDGTTVPEQPATPAVLSPPWSQVTAEAKALREARPDLCPTAALCEAIYPHLLLLPAFAGGAVVS